jgi:hypothetical protein
VDEGAVIVHDRRGTIPSLLYPPQDFSQRE